MRSIEFSSANPIESLADLCRKARRAANELAALDAAVKSQALLKGADAIDGAHEAILEANQADVEDARSAGTSPTLIDRLILTDRRLQAMAKSVREVATLSDPVGELIDCRTRPNGLEIRKVRVPIGVVAVIYEARPNVTSDVIALCLKAGNSVILRGSASACRSNQAIVDAIVPALTLAGLPRGSVGLMSDLSREAARRLMRARGEIDLLIPRGGPSLIAEIIEVATVPYVIDGDGNCHVFVDEHADLGMAERIVVNAKVSRPSVCNSAEKLLVHRRIAADFVPRIVEALSREGVRLKGDADSRALAPTLDFASDGDWPKEYLDLTMAIRIVDGVDSAIEHIRRYGSGHTEAIVTQDEETAKRFVALCPSAVTMVNASTRFTDGGEFGFGAEIGNSTQRLHARGPMGARELTTYRYEVWGSGQIRELLALDGP